MAKNLYLPFLMTIKEIRDETPDIRTLKLVFNDREVGENFQFKAGQFGLFSVLGEGEATFCIASSPTWQGFIECCFKEMGKVTKALRTLGVGDSVGFRGPYGNGFPLERMKGKNLVFIGGGIGIAPLRSLIWNVLEQRNEFGDIAIIYGARTVFDLVYKSELKEWGKVKDVKLVQTVDPGGEGNGWRGEVGFVPSVLTKVALSPENALVLICGPPVMIRYSLLALEKLNFLPENIITTMENKMKCGLGKCGRCNIGSVYVCKDGPVFTFAQIREFPNDYC